MLERLEKEKAGIEQEAQDLAKQTNQLQHMLAQAQQRQMQLQGSHQSISKLIEEIKVGTKAEEAPAKESETPAKA